ncbi:MAG: ATP-binding cassette domain-containing protein [Christensenellales bacterium]
MEPIIDVANLTKSFSKKTVVYAVSFSVEKGSLFAFLGQNGAGKTTTINMLIGLIRQEKGEILYPPLPRSAFHVSGTCRPFIQRGCCNL